MNADALAHVVQLGWAVDGGIVTVPEQDEGRLGVKLRKAAEILQLADKGEQFQRQFKLLLSILSGWLQGRTDVARGYITIRDGRLAFIVVRSSAEYDEAFEDALSDLDFRIANDVDLDLIRLDAVGLPSVSDAALSSFLDPSVTFSLS